MKHRDFERFYLEKIAIGEGCGCAEQAIGMRDMDARARGLSAPRRSRTLRKTFWSIFPGFIQRLVSGKGGKDGSKQANLRQGLAGDR